MLWKMQIARHAIWSKSTWILIAVKISNLVSVKQFKCEICNKKFIIFELHAHYHIKGLKGCHLRFHIASGLEYVCKCKLLGKICSLRRFWIALLCFRYLGWKLNFLIPASRESMWLLINSRGYILNLIQVTLLATLFQ